MKLFTLLAILLLSGSYCMAQQKDTTVILFDYNKHALNSGAVNLLQSFIESYQDEKGILMIYGHCDSRGSEEYNEKLSERRTQAVRSWLERNGVASSDISVTKGFGELQPLNQNSSEEEMQANRRVEIIWERAPEPEPVPEPVETPKNFSKETVDSLKVGDKLVLPQINFQGGLHRFMPSSMASLKELLDVMRDNPKLEIEIQGHICCRAGSEVDGIDLETRQYNLSTARAKAVYDYLVENGIDMSRMKYRGFAGKFPIVSPERSEADRTTNRRVEIQILNR